MHSRWKNFIQPSEAMEQRVEELLQQLTIEEKIDLLGGKHQYAEGNERIGLPPLKMADGPMGVHWFCKVATAYPAAIALAASWDTAVAERVGHAIGRDARARGVHCLLGPGMNLYRSPLCGRNFEYLGEDPHLAGTMAAAYIRGCQDEGVAATAKHYAVNFQEYNRHQISSDLDESTLREVYLSAFERAVTDGGAAAIMTAYNLVNGVHATENKHLILDILKGEWGFDGLVMSDWSATYDAVNPTLNGQDLEMPTAEFMNRDKLLPAVTDGRITVAMIDDKIRRRLRLAVCFGWLDYPQEALGVPEDDPESAAVALEAARGGCVLLKNEDKVLPLQAENLKKVAVLGSHAHPLVFSGGGSAKPTPAHTVSILDGLKQVAPHVEFNHLRVLPVWNENRLYNSTEYLTLEDRPGLAAEYWNNPNLEGEPALVCTDDNLNSEWYGKLPKPEITNTYFSARWTGIIRTLTGGQHRLCVRIGDGVTRIWINEQLVLDTWDSQADGLHECVLDLPDHGLIPITCEYRATRPWNCFRVGLEPLEEIQADIDEAVEMATSSDAAIVCVGFIPETESEGYDRPFALDKQSVELIQAVAQANPRTIVVLSAGGHVDMRDWLEQVPALLHVWYPGQEGGTAIAEILTGLVNPSGRLPATFERVPEDRSSFDNYHDCDGDKHVQITDGVFFGYRHHDKTGVEPLFPFGFGLSYTDFDYENLHLSAESIPPDGTLDVSFEVVNIGTCTGADVAQLYLRDVECRLPRPMRELKAFAKVRLEVGERKVITLPITARELRFYDPDCGWTVEPGAFEIFIGRHARHCALQARFEVSG